MVIDTGIMTGMTGTAAIIVMGDTIQDHILIAGAKSNSKTKREKDFCVDGSPEPSWLCCIPAGRVSRPVLTGCFVVENAHSLRESFLILERQPSPSGISPFERD
jgi:hypothetical protein